MNFHGGFFSRTREAVVFALILSLVIPLPLMGGSAQARSADSGNAHVWQRLNSPERARAIAEANRIDAAAREEFARNEAAGTVQDGLPRQASGLPRNDKAERVASSQSLDTTGTAVSSSVIARSGATRQSMSPNSSRPRTMTEVMFNGVTGFMGMPGLASQHDPYGAYDPNVDQGLGFHADGTARRADGTTGSNSASANFDGRRAAAYAGSGMGYGPNGMRGGMGMGDMNGYYGAGYDPITGTNFRYGDSTSAAYHARQGGGSGYGLFNMNDPQSYFMQRGLNYGVGMVNSAAEGLFFGVMESPYGGAKARFNFMLDLDGRVNGEGDVLLPFYDNKYTTVFTQLGARSMSGMSGGGSDGRGADRWIGNFGLGQRWYPMAVNEGTGQDAGNFMLGYNVFFDNDFTRGHQRGGVGIEAQYDWLHLASNYYLPLSGWKGSKDFDSDFVKERAAEGWDIRAKGYLPFYRNVALTGAYTQWYGDHVGMFSSRKLEKDPKVWSYGVEYTPIPLVSGFVNQRSTQRGEQDTEFGLRLTYTFDMPWDQQTSHSKVAEMRTVGASRHEFVDRENRIILEYRAKNNFQIEYLGVDGSRGFLFRLKHPLDGYVAGQTVRVTATGNYLAEAVKAAPITLFAQAVDWLDELISVKAAYAADLSKAYVTDSQGRFWVQLEASAPVATTVTVQAGNTSQSFTLQGGGGSVSPYIVVDSFTNGPNFVGSGQSTASVTVKVQNADGTPVTDGTTVTWTVTQAQNNSPAMYSGWGAKKTGLTWGATAIMVKYDAIPELTTSTTSTTTGGLATMQLTDIVGERSITIEAKAHVDGADRTITQPVNFGDGPLSKFVAPDSTNRNWDAAYQLCNGSAYSGDHSTGWSSGAYVGGGKLPTRAEYQVVAPIDTRWSFTNPNSNAKGAAFAAGWPSDDFFWTGEADGANDAFLVDLDDGSGYGSFVGVAVRVACRR